MVNSNIKPFELIHVVSGVIQESKGWCWEVDHKKQFAVFNGIDSSPLTQIG